MKKNELIGVFILLLVWEVFTLLYQNYFFPDLVLIFGSLNKISNTEILTNTGLTVFKTIISFTIGNLLGLVVGSFLGFNKTAREWSSFTVDFMRSLSSIVIFPLFMIVFGINDITKVIVTIFGIFWIVLFNTVQSIKTISLTKVKYLKTHGSNNWDIIRHYIIFVLFQNWLTILKISLSLSLFTTIVLEMFIGSEYGIGKSITDAKNYYEIPMMYFWIIIAGLVGYGLNKVVDLIERNWS